MQTVAGSQFMAGGISVKFSRGDFFVLMVFCFITLS